MVVSKKLEEDEETGSKRYVYVKLGPDHFRHAFNYECMARQNMPGILSRNCSNCAMRTFDKGAEDNTLAGMACKCGQVLALLKGPRYSWEDQEGSLYAVRAPIRVRGRNCSCTCGRIPCYGRSK